MDIQAKNKLAIEYNRKVLPELTRICQPLTNIGIKAFTYYRVFEDGSYMFLSNDPRPVDHIIQNFDQNGKPFQDNIRLTTIHKPHYMIWPMNHQDSMIRYYADTLNYGNGLCVYKRLEDKSVDSWGFIADKDDYLILNQYLNYPDVFSKFINYFNNKAQEIIQTHDKNRLAQYKTPMDISELMHKKMEEIFSAEIIKHSLESEEDLPRLTHTEIIVLKQMTTGKTMKEIALHLGISPRTIESHIRNVKKKNNLHYKSELINLYQCL